MIKEVTKKYKDGKELFTVVMKTYTCPCGYKNIGFPNDKRCENCKEKLL